MFINKVVLYDKYCEMYFNTNGDKFKQLKLKEQPDIDSEILFKSNKKEQSKKFGLPPIGGTGASQIELLSYKTLAVCVRMF